MALEVKRLALAFALSCAARAPTPHPLPASEPDIIELAETWPAGTTLDHPAIADAWQVWPPMFDRAKRSIDLEEFYASSSPSSADRLEPSILALERAVKRGVKVRILLDDTFHQKMPETPERLRKLGIEVKITKRFDANGGVLHAKFFLVDRLEVYFGSQNFDWRSLEHIQELGARVRSPAIAASLGAVFDSDWNDTITQVPSSTSTLMLGNESVRATPVFSPKGLLPDESAWDLPRIVAAIDGAKKDVRVQVLTYDAKSRDGSRFPTLDDALRRAAARGVHVRVLVSEWTRKHVTALADLVKVPNIEVHVITIPTLPGPEIPFARVAHAKYMVCDDAVAWLGTSNWEGDYFDKTRNVGLMLEGKATASVLARFFDDGFSSPYSAPY